MICDYDGCEQPVILLAYAAYDKAMDFNRPHQLVARYPGVMIRACGNHIGRLMLHDADAPGSTQQWVVTVNPTATAFVTYPPESSACANPDGPFPPGTPPAVPGVPTGNLPPTL